MCMLPHAILRLKRVEIDTARIKQCHTLSAEVTKRMNSMIFL